MVSKESLKKWLVQLCLVLSPLGVMIEDLVGQFSPVNSAESLQYSLKSPLKENSCRNLHTFESMIPSLSPAQPTSFQNNSATKWNTSEAMLGGVSSNELPGYPISYMTLEYHDLRGLVPTRSHSASPLSHSFWEFTEDVTSTSWIHNYCLIWGRYGVLAGVWSSRKWVSRMSRSSKGYFSVLWSREKTTPAQVLLCIGERVGLGFAVLRDRKRKRGEGPSLL